MHLKKNILVNMFKSMPIHWLFQADTFSGFSRLFPHKAR